MRAAIYEQFQGEISVRTVPDPEPPEGGVVLSVQANGICRSDWHGWMGHDPDIRVPHVPGHELAGVVEAVGDGVTRWRRGDRVTLPFVCGCGDCPQCKSGNHQVCDHQFQPGFTAWGSFAQFVAIRYADINLVRLPEDLDNVTAASLGCRFVTSFRAVVDQARVQSGQWVAVHGCGGVGLSAVMIASALGARVLAVDIYDEKLDLARDVGAVEVINARTTPEVVEAIRDVTEGGVHASLDALGDTTTSFNSISCLRKRGRHIQVGLMVADHSRPPVPMDQIVANELELYGSHGIQAHRYSELLQMISAGKLEPQKLLGQTVNLEEGVRYLTAMDGFEGVGVTVIDRF